MLKKLVVLMGLASASVLALALPGSSTAQTGAENRVVCVTFRSGSGEWDYSLRHRPNECTYVHRNTEPFGASTVETYDFHWRRWGHDRARGAGKTVVNMYGPTHIRVKLYRPRSGCRDVLVYTRARFYFPKFDHSSIMQLDRCI